MYSLPTIEQDCFVFRKLSKVPCEISGDLAKTAAFLGVFQLLKERDLYVFLSEVNNVYTIHFLDLRGTTIKTVALIKKSLVDLIFSEKPAWVFYIAHILDQCYGIDLANILSSVDDSLEAGIVSINDSIALAPEDPIL